MVDRVLSACGLIAGAGRYRTPPLLPRSYVGQLVLAEMLAVAFHRVGYQVQGVVREEIPAGELEIVVGAKF